MRWTPLVVLTHPLLGRGTAHYLFIRKTTARYSNTKNNKTPHMLNFPGQVHTLYFSCIKYTERSKHTTHRAN